MYPLPPDPAVVDAGVGRAIRTAVAELLRQRDAQLSIRPLAGGIGNRSYLVAAEGQRWVVRLPKPASAGSTLDVRTEHRVMSQAAAAGFAPPAVASEPDTGVLVTRYVPHARAWTAGDARWTDNIVRLAVLLRGLHRLRTDLPPFDAPSAAISYLERAEGVDPLAPEQSDWAGELEQLARAYDGQQRDTVLCHNDLVAANVLDDGRLWLVDFEYAVSGSPVLDLAGVAGMNDYDDARRRRLIEAYFGGAEPSFGPELLERTIRMVRLLAYFWAVACRARADDPEPFELFAQHTAVVLRN